MKKIFEGFFFTSIGLVIILCDIAYFFGWKPSFMPAEGAYVAKPLELFIALVIGFILVRMPATDIDRKLFQIIEKLTGDLFKKKSDEL